VLALALLAPAAAGLAACSRGARRDAPDPLIALAGAARADAALAAAALAADPGLRDRVEPLRAARAEHAAALEAEVVRAGGTLPSTAPGPPPTAPDGPPATGAPGASPSGTAAPVTLARVRESAAAAQQAAARLVPGLPADRVGLVAEVAACCAAYAEVLA
jgi:hypothetical protein